MTSDLYLFVRLLLIASLVVMVAGLVLRQRQNRDQPANPEGVALALLVAATLYSTVEAQLEGVASGFRVLVLLLLSVAGNCALYVPIVHKHRSQKETS